MGGEGSQAEAKNGRLRRYVGWEEIVMSNDRGRRVVHYYLKESTGDAVLAVVGRETSVRHMSYAVPDVFLKGIVGRSGGLASATDLGLPFKWRSRREVIDWMDLLVHGSDICGSSPVVSRYMDVEDPKPFELPKYRAISSQKLGFDSKEFLWLGATWTCSKRRNHYRSFSRNNVIIKVHDFVYIMVEGNKRLVAYVEDLYEDLKSNNMVVVRWFHKVDEIGILLPPDIHDREIFFSNCLQHFSVECIDGLASVLSSQHFEQFLNDGRLTKWEPYLCRRQIDDDDVKPFNVTDVQGYWSQELLRSLFASPLKFRFKIKHSNSISAEAAETDIFQSCSRRKVELQLPKNSGVEIVGGDKTKLGDSSTGNTSRKIGRSSRAGSPLLRKEQFKNKLQPQLSHGCHVEVLSQDSGLRGCWFRCVVLKRLQDKVKVRYNDVKNCDETENLEEWVSLSRIASPDKLGIRLPGRPMVRPCRSHKGMNWSILDIGANVDAWWHDGWWEGILVDKENDLLRVYFPGEDRCSIFSHTDVRESHDWVNERWNLVESRENITNSLLTKLKSNKSVLPSVEILAKPINVEILKTQPCVRPSVDYNLRDGNTTIPGPSLYGEGCCQDLTKDWRFDSLKWSSMKKRKRGKETAKRINPESKRPSKSCNARNMEEPNNYSGYLLSTSLNVDHENCKVGGDPLFSASMPLSSLVMSQ